MSYLDNSRLQTISVYINQADVFFTDSFLLYVLENRCPCDHNIIQSILVLATSL